MWGTQYSNVQALIAYMEKQRGILSTEEYAALRSEAGIAMNELALRLDDECGVFLAFFKTDKDFATFKSTPEYREKWGLIEKRAKSAEENARKVKKAKEAIEEHWTKPVADLVLGLNQNNAQG